MAIEGPTTGASATMPSQDLDTSAADAMRSYYEALGIPDHVPLTPQMILATVRRQLRQIDDQVASTLEFVEGQRAEAQQLGESIVALRELHSRLESIEHLDDGSGGIHVDRLNDPEAAAARELLGMTDRPYSDGEIMRLFQARLERDYGIDDYTTGESSFGLSVIQEKIDNLTEKQRMVNSGNEMVMMQLQTLMQQRTQQLQAGSNLLASIDEASKTIVGNLR